MPTVRVEENGIALPRWSRMDRDVYEFLADQVTRGGHLPVTAVNINTGQEESIRPWTIKSLEVQTDS